MQSNRRILHYTLEAVSSNLGSEAREMLADVRRVYLQVPSWAGMAMAMKCITETDVTASAWASRHPCEDKTRQPKPNTITRGKMLRIFGVF